MLLLLLLLQVCITDIFLVEFMINLRKLLWFLVLMLLMPLSYSGASAELSETLPSRTEFKVLVVSEKRRKIYLQNTRVGAQQENIPQ